MLLSYPCSELRWAVPYPVTEPQSVPHSSMVPPSNPTLNPISVQGFPGQPGAKGDRGVPGRNGLEGLPVSDLLRTLGWASPLPSGAESFGGMGELPFVQRPRGTLSALPLVTHGSPGIRGIGKGRAASHPGVSPASRCGLGVLSLPAGSLGKPIHSMAYVLMALHMEPSLGVLGSLEGCG